MPVPLDVTFRNVDASTAVVSRVRTLIRRLDRGHPGIIACKVVVDRASHRHQHRSPYKVSVDVRAPNTARVVGERGGANPAHADVYVAIRDAFDQVRRRLAAHAQRWNQRTRAGAQQ